MATSQEEGSVLLGTVCPPKEELSSCLVRHQWHRCGQRAHGTRAESTNLLLISSRILKFL